MNQTKEEADNIFVELTKAYKSCVTPAPSRRPRLELTRRYSLTDVDIRHNFEMFGHPDGKQEFSQGIALPAWVVESHNIWWVMGAYALVLGVLLPYVVVRLLPAVEDSSAPADACSPPGPVVVRLAQAHQGWRPQHDGSDLLPRSQGGDDLRSSPRHPRLL